MSPTAPDRGARKQHRRRMNPLEIALVALPLTLGIIFVIYLLINSGKSTSSDQHPADVPAAEAPANK